MILPGSFTPDDLAEVAVSLPTLIKMAPKLESQTLTELRDWLLPMLMNGQVTVT